MNLTEVVTCAECGSPMELRNSRYGKFWGCVSFPACRGTHGAHADGRPLGTPADQATKQARMRAHAAFDRLWKSGRLRREAAYLWLAERLGIPRDECHLGRFDAAQCARVIELVAQSFRFADESRYGAGE